MNLPDVFFPTHVRPHDKTREIFADYGKYLHVDITNVEDLTFRTQTAHPGSKTNLRLSATTPTLPLAQETHICEYLIICYKCILYVIKIIIKILLFSSPHLL